VGGVMIDSTVGYLMAGVFIIALLGFIKSAVGSWKHSIVTIVVAVVATLWVVIAGLLIERDISKESVSISEVKKVSEKLCDNLIEAYGEGVISEADEARIRNESFGTLINILESKGYKVE
jgi:c-di-AMP phosphodiesterase-like protein